MSTSTPQRSGKPAISSPRWSCSGKRVVVTYDLPGRVYVAKIYPLRAPNGSSVVLYGHENGLACLWRGGAIPKRTTKNSTTTTKAPTKAAPRHSATGEDVIMIDEDDDADDDNNHNQNHTEQNGRNAPQSTVSPSLPGSDAEENEADVLNPFDVFVDSLDVRLDTAVIDIALCPIPHDDVTSLHADCPAILSKDMVIAIACADASIHLVTIPLAPPAFAQGLPNQPSASEHGFLDMLIVDPKLSSRAVSRGLSLTWTATEMLSSEGVGDTEQIPGRHSPGNWNFLLAYHFASGAGVLKVFKIPLDEDGIYLRREYHHLLRHERLAVLAKSISFNPAPFPSWRHTQLLLSDSQGAVHIYQSTMPALHQSQVGELPSGHCASSWLLSLRSPFDQSATAKKDTGNVEERIDVLDAQWICSGKCIVALLADGQWGIWDIGDAGPGRQNSLLRGSSGFSGQRLSAGGLTRFALRGSIGSIQPTVFSKQGSGTAKHAESTKLIPMTPNTRKIKQDYLFGSTKQTTATPPEHSTGGISLCNITSGKLGTNRDESLLIWYNSEVYSLPNLWTYWQHIDKVAATEGDLQRDGSNTDTLFGPSLAKLESLCSGGEMITSVSQTRSQSATVLSSVHALTSDILASAEYRIIFSCPAKRLRAPTTSIGSLFHPLNSQLEQPSRNTYTNLNNQDTLIRGELGLHAMDEMLDGMAHNAKNESRRVEFTVDY